MSETALHIHPALILLLGAFVLPWLHSQARSVAIVALPLLALGVLWQLPEGVLWHASWLGLDLAPLRVDKLSRLFATIFTLMAAVGGLFALRQPSRLEVPAAFLYAGSAVGVTLAGDLVSVFVCWELMAVGSTLVLWSAGTPGAWAASRRYLMLHLFGGVVLFAGVTAYILQTGNTDFVRMSADSVAHWLILVGFLINAAAPPFSAWLPDAYPEASWSGTVFLSAFTTKTAVFVLIQGFPGTEILIWIGLFMAFYGIVYGLLENDIRRILAYAIVSQGGFMIVGVGIGSEMALNGAVAQAFCGVIYMALLLMTAGVVLKATGRRKFSELGGLFHSMPLTTICGGIGALAISSIPLTSGFVAKSMIFQAAGDDHLLWVWLALTAASAGVFLHTGLKFFYFLFFQKDSGLRPADPQGSMRWAMLIFAALCILIGVWPAPLYSLLPYATDYQPYTGAHVIAQLQLLLFSSLAFFVLLPWLKRTPTISLDLDWLYRVATPWLISGWARIIVALMASVGWLGKTASQYVLHWAQLNARPGGLFRRTWPTGSMTFWAMIMLMAYLAIYYLL